MRIAFFSDLHAHPWTEFAKPNERCSNDRLWDCVSVIYEIGDYCREHNIKFLVFGGDLFHKRGVVYTETWNLVRDALLTYAANGIHLILNDGNHDHANKTGSVHALQSLWGSSYISLIDPELGFTVCHLGKSGVSLVPFSYTDNYALFARRLEEAEKELSAGDHNIGLFHHGFKGARVGSSLEYVVKEEIDGSVLQGIFQKTFSGHYHTRQDILGCDNAEYIGSPLQHTRTDRRKATGEPKGFLVYSTTTGKTKFVPLKRPEFLLLTQSDLNKGLDVDVEGHFVDVVFHDYGGGKEGIETELKAKGARGFNVEQVHEAKVKNNAPRMVIDPALDTRSLLKKYVKHQSTDHDTDELVQLGMELLGRTHK